MSASPQKTWDIESRVDLGAFWFLVEKKFHYGSHQICVPSAM